MIKIADWFQQVNDMLPLKEEAKTVSVYPLDYPGYWELWIESKSGKRYRMMSNNQQLITNAVEFKLPGGVVNGQVK